MDSIKSFNSKKFNRESLKTHAAQFSFSEWYRIHYLPIYISILKKFLKLRVSKKNFTETPQSSQSEAEREELKEYVKIFTQKKASEISKGFTEAEIDLEEINDLSRLKLDSRLTYSEFKPSNLDLDIYNYSKKEILSQIQKYFINLTQYVTTENLHSYLLNQKSTFWSLYYNKSKSEFNKKTLDFSIKQYQRFLNKTSTSFLPSSMKTKNHLDISDYTTSLPSTSYKSNRSVTSFIPKSLNKSNRSSSRISTGGKKTRKIKKFYKWNN